MTTLLSRKIPLVALLCLVACGSETSTLLNKESPDGIRPGEGTCVLFDVLRSSNDFYALPFPFDLRRTPDGAIDLSDFPNPEDIVLVRNLLEDLEAVNGFGLNAAVYMELSAPVDPDSLPLDPAATLEPSSPVFLVDVDPDSPYRGERIPLTVRFFPEGGTYFSNNLLVALPVFGLGLRENTLYGMVITREVRDGDGSRLGMSEDFYRILTGGNKGARLDPWKEARAVLQPLFQWLEEQNYGSLYSLAAATVFRTRTVVPEMDSVAEYIFNDYPAMSARQIQPLASLEGEHNFVLQGTCLAPAFQQGIPPYCTGGGFVFDSDGSPVLQRQEEVRFCLSVPKGVMPDKGWPLVVYGHGTGGDHQSFIRKKVDDRLGERGIAVISTDEPLHGPRANPPGASPYFFYNLLNPVAGVDNHRQSAADKIFLARFGGDLVIPPEESPSGTGIFFDPENIGYMGHSQGGITGALMLGVVPSLGAAVLSGTGGGFGLTLVEQTDEFAEIKVLIRILLGFQEEETLDSFHPIGTLLQTLAEPADPLCYAGGYFRESENGRPVNLFLSEGMEDTNTPPITTEVLAAACGSPQSLPVFHEVEALQLQGIDPVVLPRQGNVLTDWGPITAVLIQYSPGDHWALFSTEGRERQYAEFFRTYFENGISTVLSEDESGHSSDHP